MSITMEQAKALKHGCVLHHNTIRSADGTCQRWRVAGRVKTWKREPHKVLVPLKHGLKTGGHLTEESLFSVHLEEDCPMETGRQIQVTIEATVYGPHTDMRPEGIGHWIENRVKRTGTFLVHNVMVQGVSKKKEA